MGLHNQLQPRAGACDGSFVLADMPQDADMGMDMCCGLLRGAGQQGINAVEAAVASVNAVER